MMNATNPYIGYDPNAMNQAQQVNPYLYGGQPYQQYDPAYFNGVPTSYAQMPNQITLQNALTDDEVKELRNMKPANAFNVNISKGDYLRSMCTHKSPAGDPIRVMNDGTNDLYCEICGTRWNADIKTREEAQELVDLIVAQMENDKLLGNLPTELVREFYTIIPMLKKWPELHEYAMNTYNKYYGNSYMYNPAEVNSINMYNSLMGNYGAPMYGQAPYGAPQMQQGYYGQAQQPQMYGQNPYVPQGQVANPNVNPMQAPYGVNPQAPNQQFVAQANNMMGGNTVYQQPYAPQQGQPVYGTPQAPQQAQPVAQPTTAPTQQPQAPATQDQGTVQTTTKIDL